MVETLKCFKLSDSNKAYKNLIGLCVSFTLTFGSFLGILSLQSSINAIDGLGLWTSSALYIVHILTSVLGPALVNMVGAKYALVLSTAVFLMYAILNYYPHWGTLMTAAVVLGLATSPMMTAMFTQTTITAIKYAPALKEEPQHTIPLFVGAVGLSAKLSLAFGSGMSAITLWNLHASSNDTSSSGASTNATTSTSGGVCDDDSASQVESNYIYYVLITVYVISTFVAILIIMLTVDNDGVESQFISAKQLIKVHLVKPLVDTIKLSYNLKIMCLTPLAFGNGFVFTIIIGMYSKAFVSDCFGVQWIGIVLVIYGAIGSVMSISAGRLAKYIHQSILLYAAFVLWLVLAIFLIFWGIRPNYYINIGAIVGFSLSESTIYSIVPGIYGYLFQDQKVVALALFQMWIAMGITVSFLTLLVLTPVQELWLAVGILALMIISYTILLCIMSASKYGAKVLHSVLVSHV